MYPYPGWAGRSVLLETLDSKSYRSKTGVDPGRKDLDTNRVDTREQRILYLPWHPLCASRPIVETSIGGGRE